MSLGNTYCASSPRLDGTSPRSRDSRFRAYLPRTTSLGLHPAARDIPGSTVDIECGGTGHGIFYFFFFLLARWTDARKNDNGAVGMKVYD